MRRTMKKLFFVVCIPNIKSLLTEPMRSAGRDFLLCERIRAFDTVEIPIIDKSDKMQENITKAYYLFHPLSDKMVR